MVRHCIATLQFQRLKTEDGMKSKLLVLGKHLREARLRAGLSQVDIANGSANRNSSPRRGRPGGPR